MNTESSASPSLDTLFGGRLAAVLHEDGQREEIKIIQLRLGDYEKAFQLIEDEIALTAFCCRTVQDSESRIQNSKAWAETLQPESYELVQASVREVNAKGFFSYAERRTLRQQQQQEKMFAALGALPPEMLNRVMELGRATLAAPSSVTGPRPV